MLVCEPHPRWFSNWFQLTSGLTSARPFEGWKTLDARVWVAPKQAEPLALRFSSINILYLLIIHDNSNVWSLSPAGSCRYAAKWLLIGCCQTPPQLLDSLRNVWIWQEMMQAADCMAFPVQWEYRYMNDYSRGFQKVQISWSFDHQEKGFNRILLGFCGSCPTGGGFFK